MNTKLTAVSVATAAFLAAGASLFAADQPGAASCIKFSPELAMAMDAGGYSATTREHLSQSTAYFVAHIELPDGKAHPVFGADPRGVYLFKTMSGRLVVRPMEIRSDLDWHSSH